MLHLRSRLALVALFAGLGLPASALAAPIVMNGPTTDWTPILFAGSTPDWANDQGTGQAEADIVGDLSHLPSTPTSTTSAPRRSRTGCWAFA